LAPAGGHFRSARRHAPRDSPASLALILLLLVTELRVGSVIAARVEDFGTGEVAVDGGPGNAELGRDLRDGVRAAAVGAVSC
jgi:integrase